MLDALQRHTACTRDGFSSIRMAKDKQNFPLIFSMGHRKTTGEKCAAEFPAAFLVFSFLWYGLLMQKGTVLPHASPLRVRPHAHLKLLSLLILCAC